MCKMTVEKGVHMHVKSYFTKGNLTKLSKNLLINQDDAHNCWGNIENVG